MKNFLCCLLFSLGIVNLSYAQETPQPCGPAGQLSEEFSKNVASDARCFELRMYTAEEAVDGKEVLMIFTNAFASVKLRCSKNMALRS